MMRERSNLLWGGGGRGWKREEERVGRRGGKGRGESLEFNKPLGKPETMGVI